MKHTVYLSNLRKIRAKLTVAQMSGSRKHINIMSAELARFVSENQENAFNDWLNNR